MKTVYMIYAFDDEHECLTLNNIQYQAFNVSLPYSFKIFNINVIWSAECTKFVYQKILIKDS